MSRHEQWLRNAFSELTGIDANQISSTQSFADLGVDSLVGLRLTRKLQDFLETEVELEWIFDNPSIYELSRFLDARFGEFDTESVQSSQDREVRA